MKTTITIPQANEMINENFDQESFRMIGLEGCLNMMISSLREYVSILEEEVKNPTKPEDLEDSLKTNPSLPTKEELEKDLKQIKKCLQNWLEIKALYEKGLL